MYNVEFQYSHSYVLLVLYSHSPPVPVLYVSVVAECLLLSSISDEGLDPEEPLHERAG